MHALQHLEGGIIAEISVKEGEMVQAGQTIVRFDATPALADLASAQARRTGQQIRAERLRAFAEDREPVFDDIPARYRDLVADQRAIFAQKTRARDKQQQVLWLQLQQRQGDENVLKSEIKKLANNLSILDEQKQLHVQLFEKGLISKVTYLSTLNEHSAAAGELAETKDKKARAGQAINEAKARLAEFHADLRDAALDEMGTINMEMTEIDQLIVQAEDRVRRLDVKAPVRGIVQELAISTVGAVVAPGAPITRIVPIDDEIIIEARISPVDVGHVSIGDEAKIKISTYDHARFGAIDGTVESISPTTFKDPDGTVYYRADIRLGKTYVGEDPERNIVLPGMTAEIDIIAGERSLLRYLLRPVYQSMDSALSER